MDRIIVDVVTSSVFTAAVNYFVVGGFCLILGAALERLVHRRHHECVEVEVVREEPRALFAEPSVVGPNSRERFGETVVAVVRHYPEED